MKKNKERILKLDVIRIVAFLFVVSVHFLLNSGYYSMPVEGFRMYFMTVIRSVFITCVPIFITLTGYLKNRKELSKDYYKGIIKILITYFIFSIIYSLFSKIVLKNEMTISFFIGNLLSYCGTQYSWYIEMYIGLFLLIPFLNIIWNHLDQKQAKWLIGTLLFMVALPQVCNIFIFSSLEWWKTPSINSNYMQLLPKWWTSIYPILYYYLGAYLSKYEVKLSTKKSIIFLSIAVLLDGVFNIYRSFGVPFVWGTWNDSGSLFVFIITFLMFHLLLKLNIPNHHGKREYLLKLLSDSCLGAYLISCMFDGVVYAVLGKFVPNVLDRFYYAPVVIGIVFICSMGLSVMVELIYRFIMKKKNDFHDGENLNKKISEEVENEKVSSH